MYTDPEGSVSNRQCRCATECSPPENRKTEIVAVGPFLVCASLRVRGLPDRGADYTAVARKMMTIKEWRRMLTGSNLRKRTVKSSQGSIVLSVCVGAGSY